MILLMAWAAMKLTGDKAFLNQLQDILMKILLPLGMLNPHCDRGKGSHPGTIPPQ
jgi:hypothetical protein